MPWIGIVDLIAKTTEHAELTQYLYRPQNSRSEGCDFMLMTHRFRIWEDVQLSSLRRGLNGWKFVNLKVLCDTRTLSSLTSSPERRRLKADSKSSHLSSHLPILFEHGCCIQL